MVTKNHPLKKIIVALDNMNRLETEIFLSENQGRFSFVKIGMEAYYAHGKGLVQELSQKYNTKIFLDLKLHDIPNTVSKAIHSLSDLPIEFLTIHLSGGLEMLKAAKRAQEQALPKTKLLGVSYLTSLDHQDFKSIWGVSSDKIDVQFERLFQLAQDSKIHGVVCSAHEAELLKNFKNQRNDLSLEVICPGIRFKDEISDSQVQSDQKRVMSPEQAFQKGADFLVIGRSLTQALDLNSRYQELLEIEKNI